MFYLFYLSFGFGVGVQRELAVLSLKTLISLEHFSLGVSEVVQLEETEQAGGSIAAHKGHGGLRVPGSYVQKLS